MSWLKEYAENGVVKGKSFDKNSLLARVNTFVNTEINPELIVHGKSVSNFRNKYIFPDCQIIIDVEKGIAVFKREDSEFELKFKYSGERITLINKIPDVKSEFETVEEMLDFAFEYLLTKLLNLYL